MKPAAPDYAGLAERLNGLFRKCNDMPELNPAAMVALLELRNMAPDLVDALRRADADRHE